MIHVTIAPDGTALALPERVRAAFADARVDRDPVVGPEPETGGRAELSSFSSSFPIRDPHIEGAELAYFEEYPRFADIALEAYLDERGTSRAELRGEKRPYHLRDWRWEFRAPVRFGTTLRVSCDVLSVERETIRVAHELESDGRTSIEGITEYGCFDRSGTPIPFDESMLTPFEA